MPIKKNILYLSQLVFYFIFFSLSESANASGPDPLVGVRLSLLGLQTVLSSPPLPSLDTKSRGQANLQASYIDASFNDSIEGGTEAGKISARATGDFRGYSASIGLTTSARYAVGLFAFAVYNSIKGELKIALDANLDTITLANMKNTGTTLATGVSWRILTNANSPVSFGVFGGPTGMLLTSEFRVVSASAPIGSVYTANPTTYGAFAGAQMGLKISELYLNPYAIYFKDLTSGCKSYKADQQVEDESCPGTKNQIKLHLSYLAYGINIGLYNLFLTAYSHFEKDQSMESISLNNYQLAYVVRF